MDDNDNPQDKSNTEKAEGSRDNVNVDPADVNHGSATDSPMERGSGQVSKPEKPLPSAAGGSRAHGPGGSARARPASRTARSRKNRRTRKSCLPAGRRKARRQGAVATTNKGGARLRPFVSQKL